MFEGFGRAEGEVAREGAFEVSLAGAAPCGIIAGDSLAGGFAFGILVGAGEFLNDFAGVAEGALAAEEFVEHHAEGVDVAAGGGGIFAELLGAGAARGEEHDLGEGCFAGALEEPCSAKVEKLDVAFFGADEDVGGLEVAVDYEVLVGVIEGGANFEEDTDAVSDREALLVAIWVEGDAVYKFCDKEGFACCADATVEEAGFEVFAGEVLGEHLDCDLLGEDAIGSVCHVDAPPPYRHVRAGMWLGRCRSRGKLALREKFINHGFRGSPGLSVHHSVCRDRRFAGGGHRKFFQWIPDGNGGRQNRFRGCGLPPTQPVDSRFSCLCPGGGGCPFCRGSES